LDENDIEEIITQALGIESSAIVPRTYATTDVLDDDDD